MSEDITAQLVAQSRSLPDYVQREFTDFLQCGLLEHGFLRVRGESCPILRLTITKHCYGIPLSNYSDTRLFIQIIPDEDTSAIL